MANIICIKVSKKTAYGNGVYNRALSVFPWDRIYLVRKEHLNRVSGLYRYFFSIPLNQGIYDLLDSLKFDGGVNESTVRRDDNKLKTKKHVDESGVPGKLNITPDGGWIIIVPTSLASIKKASNDKKATKENMLNYVATKSVKLGYSSNKVFEQLQLHTPYQTINSVCAKCKSVLDYYDGTCEPMTQRCQQKYEMMVEADTYFSPDDGTDMNAEGAYPASREVNNAG
jgi:hypothetical protein